MTTGERIEALAKERGISLRKLAMLADVSYNTIYSAVKRKSDRVDKKIVEKIAKALDLDIRRIISDDQFLSDYTEEALKKYPSFDALDAMIHVYSKQLTYEARLKLLDYIVELSKQPEYLAEEVKKETEHLGDKNRAFLYPGSNLDLIWRLLRNDRDTKEWVDAVKTQLEG